MIYFRRNNGELGTVTYGDTESDLSAVNDSRLDIRMDIVNSISRFLPKEEFNGMKPVVKGAYLVSVK